MIDPLNIRLTDLEPVWLGKPNAEGGHGWDVARTDAFGLFFVCPKCFAASGERPGCHGIICWSPQVPQTIDPKPGRWELIGDSFDDLTLVAGSSSVLLNGEGCRAHFFIKAGKIEWASDCQPPFGPG